MSIGELMTRWSVPSLVPDPMQVPPRLPAARPGRPTPGTALLVQPFYPKDGRASYGKHVLTPALTLTGLAAATPAPWRVAFWDENLLQGPPSPPELPQVVGITVHLTFAARAYEVADWFRSQGCQVVLGGWHVQACPEEAAPHADALSLGNGVRTWPQILADVAAGQLRSRYVGEFGDFGEEAVPDRAILPPWAFLTPLSVIATRGCHNRCEFCSLATDGLQLGYQMRPVEQVVAEIAAQPSPFVVFVDNNLGSSKAYLRRLCRGLAPLERIWSAAVSLDVSEDPDLVREMALAGCTGVFIGFESLTDDNLRQAGKHSPRSAEYARRVELFHRWGIQVNGSFVVGFDHDDPSTFAGIVDWVEQQRLECATYHILTPYPGTPLYRRLEAAGRLLHRDWSRYDTAHCVFQPARMSPAELEAGYSWMYQRTFSLPSIWARRPVDLAAQPAYFGMALLYKRSNQLWPQLIRHRLVHAVWRPLVEASRARHLRYRQALVRPEARASVLSAPAIAPGAPFQTTL